MRQSRKHCHCEEAKPTWQSVPRARKRNGGERKRACSAPGTGCHCPGGGLIPPASATAQPLLRRWAKRRAIRESPLRLGRMDCRLVGRGLAAGSCTGYCRGRRPRRPVPRPDAPVISEKRRGQEEQREQDQQKAPVRVQPFEGKARHSHPRAQPPRPLFRKYHIRSPSFRLHLTAFAPRNASKRAAVFCHGQTLSSRAKRSGVEGSFFRQLPMGKIPPLAPLGRDDRSGFSGMQASVRVLHERVVVRLRGKQTVAPVHQSPVTARRKVSAHSNRSLPLFLWSEDSAERVR